MRYILTLSYDGSSFCGWQIQPSAPTVQSCVQDALSKLLGKDISVTGAGRTDTGVNAINYVLHFDSDPLPYDASLFIYKLNAILPSGVAVHGIRTAPEPQRPADGSFSQDWNARYSATSREYHYFIHFRKDPFIERYSWWLRQPLDLEKMNRACAALIGEHDFSCFEKKGGNNATSICRVSEARWESYVPGHASLLGYPCGDGDYIVFTIRANRFLRNMVRAIVGSMVEIGRGRRPESWIAELMEGGSRSDAGESVPGKALFLSKVGY